MMRRKRELNKKINCGLKKLSQKNTLSIYIETIL